MQYHAVGQDHRRPQLAVSQHISVGERSDHLCPIVTDDVQNRAFRHPEVLEAEVQVRSVLGVDP